MLLFLCCWLVTLIVLSCPQGTSTTTGQTVLHLVSLVPYPDPSSPVQPAFSDGDALFIASKLAVDVVNNRTDILAGYKIELLQADCGCDLLNTLELAFFENLVYSDVNVQGVIGPGCSESALFLGNQIAQPALEVLSISLAGSYNLSARDDFKNSFSVIDSEELYIGAIQAIARDQEWGNISVLHDLSRSFFSSIQHTLETDVNDNNTQYHFMSLFPGGLRYTPDHSLPLRCIPVSRITIFLASAGVISELICLFAKNEAFRDKLYPSFQFVVVNRTPESIIQDTSFLYGDTNISCTAKEISDRLNGTVFLEYRFTPLDPVATTTTGMSYMQFESLYNETIDKHNGFNHDDVTPSVWAPAYFDSTWALILALNRSREKLVESEGLELTDYRPGLPNATTIIRDNLKQVRFSGVSGNFKLTSDGFVKRYVDVRQFISGEFRKFEYYDSSIDKIRYFDKVEKVEYITWHFNKVMVSNFALGGILITFIILITALILAVHIISILNRHHPAIKATNINLYQFAYVGVYLQSLGSVVYIVGSTFGISEVVHCSLLYNIVFMNSAGVVMVFSALAAISFRVYRIFVHYMRPGRLISDKVLVVFLFTTTILYVVCYTTVSRFYLPRSNTSCVSTEKDILFQRVNCIYDFPQWMITAQIIPSLLSLLAFTFAALSIGKVKIKKFQTGSILLVCFFSLCNVTVWIVYYQIQVIGNATNPSLGPVVGITAFSHIVCLLFLFLPPSFPVIKDYYNARLKKYFDSCHRKLGTNRSTKQRTKDAVNLSQENIIEAAQGDMIDTTTQSFETTYQKRDSC